MKIRDAIASRIASKEFLKASNSLLDGQGLAQQFLRFGNQQPMGPDWSQVVMSDKDSYTGYMYAAIRNRANRVAQLAKSNIHTDASKTIADQAKKADETIIHPYLELINSSNTFSNTKFWRNISTFTDIKGAFYILAVRTVDGSGTDSVRVGHVQEFKLLNPYNVSILRGKNSIDVVGYRETRGGWTRDIPIEMIIPIEELNPFSETESYSMVEAAKDSQFTLKEASGYTRSSLRNNVNAPGIISTSIVMDDIALRRFKDRITNKIKGEPIFTDGAGNVSYNPMQIDLDKAALDKINSINLEQLLAVSGMSRTTFGIEVSGVTRDTSVVQFEQLISSHTIPRIEDIIDALDQDYKRYYPNEYKQNSFTMIVDSPLEDDREAEKQDIEIRKSGYDLYVTLVNEGYERGLAARFANGEIDLDDLGDPTLPPKKVPLVLSPTRVTVGDTGTPQSADAVTPPAADEPDPAVSEVAPAAPKNQLVHNALEDTSIQLLQTQEASLKNAIVNIQQKLVSAVIQKVSKNDFETTGDIVDQSDEQQAKQDLETVLTAFYGVVLPLYGAGVMNRRMKQLGYVGSFKLDQEVNNYIRVVATKAADSHVSTILGDLLKAAQDAQAAVVADRAKRLEPNPSRTPEEALAEARRLLVDDGSGAGLGHDQVVQALKTEYATISASRADLIAKSEANRAFTSAQYQADRQFLGQNDLTGRAYKQWVTRSDNPCPFCTDLAAGPPVPFDTNFADIGDVLTSTYTKADGTTSVRKMKVDYEPLSAGNAHPRCQCEYELIVR
jgi:Phage portal protein